MKISSALLHAIAGAGLAGVCSFSEATNICDETAPSNRRIDGIPAYAQCTASNGSVYSNNGVDTRTTSGGTDWVRTQGSGGYQCTEFAHRYLTFRWNIKSVPNGMAGTWCDGTPPTGMEKKTLPVHGDIIVFAPGVCGAGASSGHVAVVDVVNTNATVTIVEQNVANRRTCTVSCASCFLHVIANNGSVTVRAATIPGVNDEADFNVRTADGAVTIELTGSLKEGASVGVFDLCGRQIIDLSDRVVNGRAVFSAAQGSSRVFMVSIRKGGMVFSRKIALGK